ncbi:hypothetical protein CPC08DRAFT_73866 [Agrocybe pediades]|nr:hypothetical protein CPC08DRAFT_73866 [Agrocybe pediades]
MTRIPQRLLASVLTVCLWQSAFAAPVYQATSLDLETRALAELAERDLTSILQNIECSASAKAVVSGLGSALGVLNKINTKDATVTKDIASVKDFLNKANTVGQAIVGACNKASASATASAASSAAKAAAAAAQKAAGSACEFIYPVVT